MWLYGKRGRAVVVKKKKLKNQKERKDAQLSKDKDMGVSRISRKAKFEKGEIPERLRENKRINFLILSLCYPSNRSSS